jgi:hypothetical protein
LAHIIGTRVSETIAEMTIGHEEQGDQYRDQRDRQADDGEADLFGAFERRLERRITRLDVARHVLDHHDRIVDDEPGRDRQRHQRQIVEAEPAEIHHRQRADERQRHRKTGDQRCRRAAQEDEDHRDDQHDREAQFEFDIGDRGADRGRPVGQHGDVDRLREGRAQ